MSIPASSDPETDEDLLTLVAMVLSDEGYTVATARDGLEGLREVEHRCPI